MTTTFGLPFAAPALDGPCAARQQTSSSMPATPMAARRRLIAWFAIAPSITVPRSPGCGSRQSTRLAAAQSSDHATADPERMADRCAQAADQADRIAGDTELAQHRRRVEVDAFTDEFLSLEHERRQDRHLERSPRRRQPAQRPGVGAAHHGLDQDRIVRVVQREQLIALVRERGSGLLEVAANLGLAIEDVARPDQLVAGVMEGLHGGVVVVAVLGVHVLADELLADPPYLSAGGGHASPASPCGPAPGRSSAGG